MAEVSFGNPVEGLIRPPGSPFKVGSFRVTFTFAEHVGDGRGGGVDIGNGRCGAPVLAMADGRVTMAKKLGKANVVRIMHEQFGTLESGYAHLATMDVKLKQRVRRGQRIGTLGRTGARACHLHLGMKRDGIEVDGWPMLDQNREGEMLRGTNAVRVDNRRGFVLGDRTRFRSSPRVEAGNVLVELAKDTEIAPDFIVDGGTANGSVKWYGTWGTTPRGLEFGYVHVSTISELAPIETAEDLTP